MTRLRAALFLGACLVLTALPASGSNQVSELEHFWSTVRHQCGPLTGSDHWSGSTVRRSAKKCVITGRFSVAPNTKPPPPPPTSTAAPIPTATTAPTATATVAATATVSLPASPNAYLLRLLNEARATYGAAGLTEVPAEDAHALSHAEDMAATGFIWHENSLYPTDSFPADLAGFGSYSAAAENVGMAQGDELDAIAQVHALMMSEPHSPGCEGNHACAIISPQYTRVGLGVYYAAGSVWVVECFAGP